MNLRNRKVRSSSFVHYLGTQNLPKALGDDELKANVAMMLAGDDIARDKVIVSHMRLALSIVGRYVTALGHKRYVDEMVAAALHAMLRKVERLRKDGVGSDFNITPVFTAMIHNGIASELRRMKLIRVPKRTNDHRKKKGFEPIPEPVIVEYDTAENRSVGEGGESTLKQGWWKHKVKTKPTHSVTNDKDLKNVICIDAIEKAVFDFRTNQPKPLSDREIAERLGTDAMTVCRARKRIGERLKKELQL
jgi:DNA-directed RNA polymerase specialized sigma subunit